MFSGQLFPFLFITIACGALSGFATGSSPAFSICLRLAMALILDWAFINR